MENKIKELNEETRILEDWLKNDEFKDIYNSILKDYERLFEPTEFLNETIDEIIEIYTKFKWEEIPSTDKLLNRQQDLFLTYSKVNDLINDSKKEIDNLLDNGVNHSKLLSNVIKYFRGIEEELSFLDYRYFRELRNSSTSFSTYPKSYISEIRSYTKASISVQNTIMRIKSKLNIESRLSIIEEEIKELKEVVKNIDGKTDKEKFTN